MPTLAIAAFKGGCGKTTVASNLAAMLASQGKSVCLWDCDFQANATMTMGVDPDSTEGKSLFELVHGQAPFERVTLYPMSGVALVPANDDLSAFDLDFRRADVLREVLQPVRELFEVHILDTAPSLSLLGVNTMVAADRVLVVAQLRRFGVRGTQKYVRHLQQINPHADILVVPTFYHRGKSVASVALQELRRWGREEGVYVTDVVIPERTAVENAQAYHARPYVSLGYRDELTYAFERLAKEVLQ